MHIVAKKIGGSLSYDAQPLREFLAKYEDGEEFFIDISHLSEIKSKEQLGFYFRGIVEYLIKNCEQFGGWNKHDVHKWLKEQCAYGVDVSEMDRKEFSEYIDRCIKRLADEGVYVPTPTEYFESLKGKRCKYG